MSDGGKKKNSERVQSAVAAEQSLLWFSSNLLLASMQTLLVTGQYNVGKNKLNVSTVFPSLLFGKSQCSQAHVYLQFYLQLFTDIPMYLLHIIHKIC